MQQWFVGERSESPVVSVRFDGADAARPAPGVLEALRTADTIVICPSNPVISIGPILAVPGIRDALVARRERVIAISPIVGGAPVKGPADRLMAPLGIDVSCVGVARAYAEICGTLVIDAVDEHLAADGRGRGRPRDRDRHDDAQPRDRDAARAPHARRGRLIELRCPPRSRSSRSRASARSIPATRSQSSILDAATRAGHAARRRRLSGRDAEDRVEGRGPAGRGSIPLDLDARRRLVESESVRIVRAPRRPHHQRDARTGSCARTRASTCRTSTPAGPRCSRRRRPIGEACARRAARPRRSRGRR